MKNLLVVVVDDDHDDLSNILDAFEMTNCADAVLPFQNVEDLYQHLDRAAPTPQLIILDHQAPHAKGGEALTKLRASRRFDHTSVVIYSSHLSPPKKVELLATGADLCLAKALTIEQIMQDVLLFCEAAKKRMLT